MGRWKIGLLLPAEDFGTARRNLVKNQIEARGVKDRWVLDALLAVERHLFVPQGSRGQAYADYPLPIGEGQTISQPYIVALMSEALGLSGTEKVLEVGTGSGYQAAVLSRLCREVYTVEIRPPLAEAAALLLPAALWARRGRWRSAGTSAASVLLAFAAGGAGFVFAEMHMLDAMALGVRVLAAISAFCYVVMLAAVTVSRGQDTRAFH